MNNRKPGRRGRPPKVDLTPKLNVDPYGPQPDSYALCQEWYKRRKELGLDDQGEAEQVDIESQFDPPVDDSRAIPPMTEEDLGVIPSTSVPVPVKTVPPITRTPVAVKSSFPPITRTRTPEEMATRSSSPSSPLPEKLPDKIEKPQVKNMDPQPQAMDYDAALAEMMMTSENPSDALIEQERRARLKNMVETVYAHIIPPKWQQACLAAWDNRPGFKEGPHPLRELLLRLKGFNINDAEEIANYVFEGDKKDVGPLPSRRRQSMQQQPSLNQFGTQQPGMQQQYPGFQDPFYDPWGLGGPMPGQYPQQQQMPGMYPGQYPQQPQMPGMYPGQYPGQMPTIDPYTGMPLQQFQQPVQQAPPQQAHNPQYVTMEEMKKREEEIRREYERQRDQERRDEALRRSEQEMLALRAQVQELKNLLAQGQAGMIPGFGGGQNNSLVEHIKRLEERITNDRYEMRLASVEQNIGAKIGMLRAEQAAQLQAQGNNSLGDDAQVSLKKIETNTETLKEGIGSMTRLVETGMRVGIPLVAERRANQQQAITKTGEKRNLSQAEMDVALERIKANVARVQAPRVPAGQQAQQPAASAAPAESQISGSESAASDFDLQAPVVSRTVGPVVTQNQEGTSRYIDMTDSNNFMSPDSAQSQQNQYRK